MLFGIAFRDNLLLEEDRSETTVEGTNTLVLEDLTETTDETVGEARGGDETNTGSLERAEGNGSEELGSGGRDGVDGSAVLAGLLHTNALDGLGLEELVTSELEGTLGEVTSEGRTSTGQESTSTLVLNNLAEGAEHALVVGGRVQLDLGLDAVALSVLGHTSLDELGTYTSTGVKAPWVTEQQTAPAKAKRAMRSRPWGPCAVVGVDIATVMKGRVEWEE